MVQASDCERNYPFLKEWTSDLLVFNNIYCSYDLVWTHGYFCFYEASIPVLIKWNQEVENPSFAGYVVLRINHLHCWHIFCLIFYLYLSGFGVWLLLHFIAFVYIKESFCASYVLPIKKCIYISQVTYQMLNRLSALNFSVITFSSGLKWFWQLFFSPLQLLRIPLGP